MDLKEEQARVYLEEAELSLEAAKAIFQKAKDENIDLWAQVIKLCYDSIEQAVSSALAKKGEVIPKEHPAKIARFVTAYKIPKEFYDILFYWLRKRASSQYVDIKNDKIIIPHEFFKAKDAEKALDDCERVIIFVKNLN